MGIRTAAEDEAAAAAAANHLQGPSALSSAPSAATDGARRTPAQRRRPLSGRHDSRASAHVACACACASALHGGSVWRLGPAFVAAI